MKKIYLNNLPVRLDMFLTNDLTLSRTKVQNLIKNGSVKVNDVVIFKNGHMLELNDEIEIKIEVNHNEKTKKQIDEFEYNLDIIYEDPFLLIVNKPSGMLTHPTKFNEHDTLMNALITKYKNKCNPIVTHRLDKDTSGLVVVAKDEKTLALMQKLFETHQVEKKYLAIVHNRFNEQEILIDVPIGRSKSNKLKMIANENAKNAKNAITYVKLIENYYQHALIDVSIKTGRTHQIRTHMRYINHPIVNDPLYGVDKNCSNYGQFLMAYSISFIHPITNERISKNIEMDQMFIDIIKDIKKIK